MIENVLFTRAAEKDLRRLDLSAARAIVTALLLYVTSEAGDVKPLKGFTGLFRLRVGDYRVIFMIVERRPLILEVIEVVKRGDAYKKKSRQRVR